MLTAARYPGDQRLRRLLDDLYAAGPRFADLREGAEPGTEDADRLTLATVVGNQALQDR